MSFLLWLTLSLGWAQEAVTQERFMLMVDERMKALFPSLQEKCPTDDIQCVMGYWRERGIQTAVELPTGLGLVTRSCLSFRDKQSQCDEECKAQFSFLLIDSLITFLELHQHDKLWEYTLNIPKLSEQNYIRATADITVYRLIQSFETQFKEAKSKLAPKALKDKVIQRAMASWDTRIAKIMAMPWLKSSALAKLSEQDEALKLLLEEESAAQKQNPLTSIASFRQRAKR